MSETTVISFEQGDGKNKQLLGGKGANLCEMTQIGIRVPPGFVISTAACRAFLAREDKTLDANVMPQVRAQMLELENKTGTGFGDANNPLLVSVRSGAAMSMPGMMDTILNLGLNDQTLEGLIAHTGDERFGYDSYRRFIQLFGKVALGVGDEHFDAEFENVKQEAAVKEDIGLSAENLKEIAERFLQVVKRETGQDFPANPYVQLEIAIKAVFSSWMGKRAIDYRKQFNITADQADGTAVNVVTMVFGNRGNDSATGVAFTRNPGTGENRLYGEYLVNAQGEDVVAGIRTPKTIDHLADEMPQMHHQLLELRDKLESHYREVQDFEFTIERGILYCLQTRNGKMNAAARVHTSVEMVADGLIDKQRALLRIQPADLEQLLHPRLDPNHQEIPLAKGLPASPGAASGIAIFDADRAVEHGENGEKIILVREETKPEDIHGFFVAQGVLTSRGGKTSHAAVVARGMGKACVAGAEGILVDDEKRQARIGETLIREGDAITIDGSNGAVYLGQIPTIEAEFSDELRALLAWADAAAKLKVLANADTPDGAAKALSFGAQGIGLCRTERMFNAADRLPIVLEMILADTPETRQVALNKLLPIQRSDFAGLFRTMAPRPVTIRLLDPPIHEFLPNERALEEELTQLEQLHKIVSGVEVIANSASLLSNALADSQIGRIEHLPNPNTVEQMIEKKRAMLLKVRSLHEVNPMLGHRGVRLGITFPEIYSMQIRAVLEAAAECARDGLEVQPEIMIPQVATVQELKKVRSFLDEIRPQVEMEYAVKLNFVRFGSMLEVVRACLQADALAQEAEFFSFGTNDLSQATFSFSREDAENKFLPQYNELGILKHNPFEVLDVKGVGRLMKLAVDWGRGNRPDMKIGICGEHGGHPYSIEFCHQIGLTYVSCSPPRVPVARLAAAHAALKESSNFQAITGK